MNNDNSELEIKKEDQETNSDKKEYYENLRKTFDADLMTKEELRREIIEGYREVLNGNFINAEDMPFK